MRTTALALGALTLAACNNAPSSVLTLRTTTPCPPGTGSVEAWCDDGANCEFRVGGAVISSCRGGDTVTCTDANNRALAACSSGGADAGPVDAAADPCGPPVPPASAPYGTSEGRSFLPFTLENCDGSGPYDFYGDNQWCEPDHRLTVVSIAGVWCVPCQMESAMLTSIITEPYRDRGVRVIQVIVDGPVRGGGAVMSDCEGWVSTYGLTNVELIDSGGERTGIYFPSGSLPSTIIIDDEGIIRFYEDGVSVGLETLRATIESLLAEP